VSNFLGLSQKLHTSVKRADRTSDVLKNGTKHSTSIFGKYNVEKETSMGLPPAMLSAYEAAKYE
jgi:hypothetical protein